MMERSEARGCMVAMVVATERPGRDLRLPEAGQSLHTCAYLGPMEAMSIQCNNYNARIFG